MGQVVDGSPGEHDNSSDSARVVVFGLCKTLVSFRTCITSILVHILCPTNLGFCHSPRWET